MPALGTKPALALTMTAAVVMGFTGISQARVASTTPDGSTPANVRGGHGGPGLGADATALASRLGITVADLQAAVKAVRDSESKSDASDDRVTEAKTIADSLGVDQSTIQTVLDDQKPTAHEGLPKGPRGTTPPTGTTPAGATAGTTPTGTTPSATTPPKGGPGAGHGGPGRVSVKDSENATLIAAIEKATGKDEASVTAALKKADAVRDAAKAQRDADFAKKLAAQLHLDGSKVATAIETARAAQPARAARQTSGQAG